MGVQSSDTNMQLVLYNVPKAQNEDILRRWNINPIFIETIENLKKNCSPQLLKNIITWDGKKLEILKYVKDNKLVTSNVYVFVIQRNESSGSSKNDDLNPSVVMASTDLEEILESIKNGNQSINFNPLARMTRELQFKIQVKLIEYEPEASAAFQFIYQNLLKSGCSVQVFESFETFENSLLFSKSDFTICRRSEQATNYTKSRQKSYYNDLIYFVQQKEKYWFPKDSYLKVDSDYEEVPLQHADKKIYKITSLPEFISNADKEGYRLQPITKVFVMSRIDNKAAEKKKRRKETINKLKKLYSHNNSQQLTNHLLQFREFDNNAELIQNVQKILEVEPYITILFIHSRSKNTKMIRDALKKLRLFRRVLFLTMKSFPFPLSYPQEMKSEIEIDSQENEQALRIQKVESEKFKNIKDSHYYRIEKRVARSIDIIDQSVFEKSFENLKQHLKVFTEVNLFKNIDDYQKKLSEKGKKPSPFIVCNYFVLNLLKYEYTAESGLIFICYDTSDNLLLLKKDKVFRPSEYSHIYSAERISNISEIIKSRPIEQLILYQETHQQQAILYNIITEKYYIIKRKGKVIEFQAEVIGNNYSIMQQICFFKDPGYDPNWGGLLKNFLLEYSLLWKMEYIPTNDFNRLKDDCLKSVNTLYRNEVIQTTDAKFYELYFSKIDGCKSLSELTELIIYLFSLPHGMNAALNYLLINFSSNLRVVSLFKPLLFVLMLNYTIVFQPKYQMQRKILHVYYNHFWEKDTKFEVKLQIGAKIYNNNFMECWQSLDQDKNYIEIEYEYYPLIEFSPYYCLLQTNIFSFYKTGAEYTFSPYSCFEVKQIKTLKGNQVIRVKHIPNYDFISTLMNSNLSCSDPVGTVFMPLIEEKKQDFIEPKKMKQKQQVPIYYNFITSASKNMIHMADYFFHQIDKIRATDQSQNNQTQTFKALQEVWLEIKIGEFEEAKSKLQKISNALSSHLKIDFKKLQDLIDQIVKSRKQVLENTNFEIFKLSPSINNTYKWECRYQQNFDQFCLFEVESAEQQNLTNSEFGFIRVPQNFSFIQNYNQSSDPSLGEVLSFTKIKEKQASNENKRNKSNKIQADQIGADFYMTLLEQELQKEQQSSSSDEEENLRAQAEKPFVKKHYKGTKIRPPSRISSQIIQR